MSNLNKDSCEHWDITNMVRLDELFTQPSTFIGDIEDWDISNITIDPEAKQFAEIVAEFILPVVMNELLAFFNVSEENIKLELEECLKYVDESDLKQRKYSRWLKVQMGAYSLKSGHPLNAISKAIADFTETL